MSTEQDRRTLYDAGITDTEHLVQIAAAFLRRHPLNPPEHSSERPNALSDREQAFLRASGARGLDGEETDTFNRNVTVVAAEYAQMAAAAFSQRRVAEMLNIPAGRVRQRICRRTLYAVEDAAGDLVLPRFQFADGRCLPGMETVLSAINPQAHPVAVQRFFLTQTADLESCELGRALSPREWLVSGHAPCAVVTLAQEL